LIRARDSWKVEVVPIKWARVFLKGVEKRQHILTQTAEILPGVTREGEEERLFRAMRPDYHPFVRFALISGLRFDNILTLTWDQIKWKEGYIEVRLKSEDPEGELFYLPITNAMLAILSAELGRHPIFVFTFLCRKADRRYGYRKGERYPFTKGGFWKVWDETRRAAGLWFGKKSPKNLRFHDLRHTAATRVGKTSNLKTVQKFLGHKKIATTARYAATDVEDVREALEKVDAAQPRHKLIVYRKKK
jgi:integrase